MSSNAVLESINKTIREAKTEDELYLASLALFLSVKDGVISESETINILNNLNLTEEAKEILESFDDEKNRER